MSENLGGRRSEEEAEEKILEPVKETLPTPEDIFGMSLKQIKEKFPERYAKYLENVNRESSESISEIPEERKEEFQRWLVVLLNLDAYVKNHQENEEDRTLRERQFTVFEDLRDFLENGNKEGYVKLPTGAGKTVVFAEFIEATGLKTLVVVPTKLLVSQTKDKLEEFAQGLDVGGRYSEEKREGEHVTVITYDSLVRGLKDDSVNPDDYQLLVLDEAHTALSNERSKAVEKFSCIKIGFTATPTYSANKRVGNLLSTEIHNLGVREAAEEGVVSPFSVILAQTNVNTSNVKVTRAGEYDQEDLQRSINIESRNQSAVKLYKEMFDGELAVVYCMSVQHAKDVVRLFNDENISATVIYGDQDQREQQVILKKYARGEVKVLCNADILIAGFDEPKASVCLNLRPTLSPVIAEQRGGRVLRLDEENENKHATIVEFLDRNSSKRNQPVTFAQVAGCSVAYKKSYETSETSPQKRREKRTYQKIDVEGLEITTDANEVMKITRQMELEKAEKAPEGWMTLQEFVDLGFGRKKIENIASQYRNLQLDWFKDYLNKANRLFEHYSPELVAIIKEEVDKQEKAPEGWITNKSLAKEMYCDSSKVEGMAETYKVEHSDWFRLYLGETGGLFVHYSPELAAIIKEEVGRQEKAPEGWITNNSLAKEMHCGETKTKGIAQKYKNEHPDWFGNYLGVSNRITEHYSPELVAIIKEEVDKQEKAPEGWMTNRALAGILKIGKERASRLANNYRGEHSYWFKEYISLSNQVTEHYSPELIEKIKKDLGVE